MEDLYGWCYDLEQWRDVAGYEDRYEISTCGQLRAKAYVKHSANMGGPISYWTKVKLIRPSLSDGYLQVVLSKNKVRKTIKLHILVAKAFLPNPLSLPQVNHKDSNRTNNSVSNLEWVTAQQNVQHSYDTGSNSNSGELHPRSLLTEELVKTIREMFMQGVKTGTIAKMLGFKQSTVSKVAHRRNWSHVA